MKTFLFVYLYFCLSADTLAEYLETCENYKTISIDDSTILNNNEWGVSSDGAGSQCVWYDSGNGKWGVNAGHSSGSLQDIKGYPSIVRGWIWFDDNGSVWVKPSDTTYPVQVNRIASFTSSWQVTVPENGEKYNTAYDLWLDRSDNPNYKAQYEIMVWLNYQGPAYNGGDFAPIGNKIAGNVALAGHNWDIYTGWNGGNNVFSFRRTTNTNSVKNLDLLALINYAKDQGYVTDQHYLLGLQAGWEVVAGGAFKTESFSGTLTKK